MMATVVDPAVAAAREWDDWSLHEEMTKTPERKGMRTVAIQASDGVLEFDEVGSPGSSSTVMVDNAQVVNLPDQHATVEENEVMPGNVEPGMYAAGQQPGEVSGGGNEVVVPISEKCPEQDTALDVEE